MARRVPSKMAESEGAGETACPFQRQHIKGVEHLGGGGDGGDGGLGGGLGGGGLGGLQQAVTLLLLSPQCSFTLSVERPRLVL